MSASVIEAVLARVEAALLNHTSAGANVFRGRQDALGDDEIPGLNIKRGDSDHQRIGDNGEKVLAVWTIEHFVKGEDWETRADALHMEVDSILKQDTQLAALGRGLRCMETNSFAEAADTTVGKLTARYQMQIFVRPGDLTRAIK